MNAPIRNRQILHIITGDLFAGAERVQELLRTHMPKHGYDLNFACLKEGIYQQRLMQTEQAESFVMRSKFDLINVVRAVQAHVRRLNCELIHTHTVRSALVGHLVARETQLPLVHHVHSPTKMDSHNVVTRWINSRVEKFAVRSAARLLPVSESLRDYLIEEGYAKRRIVTVPNGVPVQAGRSTNAAGDSMRIGIVALFRPRKGVEVLLQALATLKQSGANVHLNAIGGFETIAYESQLKRLADELQVSQMITWRGFCDDIVSELRRIDLLALPSLYGEGMPMVVLEAMSVGLPIVASRIEGVPQLVRDRQDGLLVSPNNAKELSEALQFFLDNPEARSHMGERGRERQATHFSAQSTATAVARIYDELLATEETGVRPQIQGA